MSQSYILTFFYGDGSTLKNDAWRNLHNALWASQKFLYIGSQLEECPTTKKPHWQAFVKFKRGDKQKKTWFANTYPLLHGIHAEVCSVERAEAINYGIKADTRLEGPMETGEKPVPKTSAKKFEEAKEAILENRKEDVPFQMVLQFRLEQRWDGLRKFYQKDEREDLPAFLPNPWAKCLISSRKAKKRHYWIYSRQPNLGKTYLFAKPLAKTYKVSIQNGDFSYFSVEESTQCVIFDEYNTPALKWSTLNAMCDGTFGFRRMYMPKLVLSDPLIIVLSNQSILDLYPHAGVFLTARFIEIELV